MKKFNYNKYNLIMDISIGLLGILIGIISTILSIRSNEDIASRSGSFDKPRLQCSLGDLNLHKNINQIFYGDNYGDSALVISSIPLVLKNIGEKTTSGITVTFRYPIQANMVFNKDTSFSKLYGRISSGKYIKTYSAFSDFEYVSYDVPDLNPGEIFVLHDQIALPLTVRRDTLTLSEYSPDKVTDLIFSIPVNVSITAKDIQVQDYVIEITCLPASSETELQTKIEQLIYSQKSISDEQLNIIERARMKLSSQTDKFVADFVVADSSLSNFKKNIFIENNFRTKLLYGKLK